MRCPRAPPLLPLQELVLASLAADDLEAARKRLQDVVMLGHEDGCVRACVRGPTSSISMTVHRMPARFLSMLIRHIRGTRNKLSLIS